MSSICPANIQKVEETRDLRKTEVNKAELEIQWENLDFFREQILCLNTSEKREKHLEELNRSAVVLKKWTSLGSISQPLLSVKLVSDIASILHDKSKTSEQQNSQLKTLLDPILESLKQKIEIESQAIQQFNG